MEKDARTKLIETATQLFAQKGFNTVSIRELARTAKVNSALISYYFGSKEGLYQEVLEEQFILIAQMLRMFEEIPPASPIESITLYAKNIAVIHQQRPYLTRFIISEIINPTPCCEAVIKKYISRIFRFLHATLEEGIAAGDFKPDLNRDFAIVSLAGIMNFFFIGKPIFLEFTSSSEKIGEEYTAQALDTFLNGILRRKEHE
ncbi:MAG: transcriptional regulator, TetR family [Pelosinus sp.]|jgi:AcrR family transcriptional regulator|nr:transcriptional regulator, TetR family [Pelosinus sp.]